MARKRPFAEQATTGRASAPTSHPSIGASSGESGEVSFTLAVREIMDQELARELAGPRGLKEQD